MKEKSKPSTAPEQTISSEQAKHVVITSARHINLKQLLIDAMTTPKEKKGMHGKATSG